MKWSGRSLGEHVRLLIPVLGFVTGVWALQLILLSLGAPLWLIRPVSIVLATAISVLLVALLVHRKRFGGYSNVVAAIFLLMVWVQVLISLRILVVLLLGLEIPNRPPRHPPELSHVMVHLTVGLGFTTVLGSAMGCLLLFLFRKLVPTRK